jgi:hypothetical protein
MGAVNESDLLNRREFVAALAAATVGVAVKAGAEPVEAGPRRVFLVPNFHPASCGWLTTFSREKAKAVSHQRQ